MKNSLFLVAFIGCVATTSLFAQRANLDREYFKVSYVELPTNPILDDAKRTFTSSNRKIFLEGFSRIAENGTLDFRFDFHGTKISDVDIKKVIHEKKDKEGNVTETTYTYDIHCGYSSTGTLSMSNSESGENESYPYSQKDGYSKTGFSSYSKANSYYNNNRYNIRDEYRTNHRNAIVRQINNRINRKFGYVPVTKMKSEHFWIIATKKHPERAKHQEVYEAVKAIFEKMEFDQPVDAIATELQPHIDYFNDVATRYPNDDKKHKKVRYASYYNIAQMYLFLDQPAKAKEYADKLIANDYDKKDGKRFNKNADDLINDFAVNQINTRHFEVVTEDLSNEPEVQEVVVTGEPETASEKAVAFLITAANDTVQTTVSVDELVKMSAKAHLFDQDNIPTEVAAKDSKKIVLTTGDTFEVASFTSSVASESASAPKFVKTVYQGSKITLYEHMGKEYVLKFNNEEKGISTMSKDFVFGFNQKLASFCADCDALKTKVSASEFKNTKEGLLAFSKAFDSCANAK
ncbi:hypothetical protein N9954_06090 [Maribacter sp.]|nr:hypothetical protein [Maribacter sp.]